MRARRYRKKRNKNRRACNQPVGSRKLRTEKLETRSAPGALLGGLPALLGAGLQRPAESADSSNFQQGNEGLSASKHIAQTQSGQTSQPTVDQVLLQPAFIQQRASAYQPAHRPEVTSAIRSTSDRPTSSLPNVDLALLSQQITVDLAESSSHGEREGQAEGQPLNSVPYSPRIGGNSGRISGRIDSSNGGGNGGSSAAANMQASRSSASKAGLPTVPASSNADVNDQLASATPDEAAAATATASATSDLDDPADISPNASGVALPGDFQQDGVVSGADFLAWQRGYNTEYDANDLGDWNSAFGTDASASASVAALPGDYDSSGVVSGTDYLAWQRGFGSKYGTNELFDWENNFGVTNSPAEVALAVQVDITQNLDHWSVNQSGGQADPGSVTVQAGSATITEGDSYWATLSHTFVVPEDPDTVSFVYQANLDTTDPDFVNDAFEVALVGAEPAAGNSVVVTLGPGRDAWFNVTEGEPPVTVDGATIEGDKVTLDASGLIPGTAATLVFRLVNNDADTGSQVTISQVMVPGRQLDPVAGKEDGDWGYRERAIWHDSESGESRVLPAGSAGGSASWVTGAEGGDYEIYVNWEALPTTAPDATYEIYDGANFLGAVSRNQQFAPMGGEYEGKTWSNLGTFAISTGVPTVVLQGSEQGDVIADGILLVVPAVATTIPAPSSLRAGRPQRERTEIDLTQLTNVSGSIQVDYRTTSLSEVDSVLFTDMSLTNLGNAAMTGPLIAVIENLSDVDIGPMFPDGQLPDGRMYFDFTPEMDGGTLDRDDSTRTREIRFLNPADEQFTFEFVILGGINRAPEFLSSPLLEIEAGSRYRDFAEAADPDGQPITYSIAVGPEGLSIDPETGEVLWQTVTDDTGDYSVTLHATDPFGLAAEQIYTLRVLDTLQNRPPIFVTDPVTDAIASAGFEITTVATGDTPAGVAVISGFQGPRLVSIDAGDQTITVLAGENNDRFDDVTTISTGEPQPTDSLFNVGYSIDIGLPAFESTSDSNDVLGMDQGDLNGDGILDLVALAFVNPGSLGPDYFQITRMLGDGDGNFSDPVEIGKITTTNTFKNLVISDINGDGNLDVMALERRTSNVVSMLGSGDGTFTPMVMTTLDVNLDDFRIVDLDGDGKVDLVGRRGQVGFGIIYDLVWKPGLGDGTFAAVEEIAPAGSTNNPVNANARPYRIVDIDGDLDNDIVFATSVSGNIDILLNDGNQQFTLGVTLDPPAGSTPFVVQVADFTGDGKLDVFSINRWNSNVDMFVGDGSGTNFTYRAGASIHKFSGNIAGSDNPVDIDGDGDLDLIFGSILASDPISPQILRNDGTGKFTRTDYPIVDFVGQVSENHQVNKDMVNGGMFSDYNRDGVMDFVYSTYQGDFNGVGIRLGTRPGEFGATRTIPFAEDTGNFQALAADFNGDGINDLLALRADQMFLGVGDGTYQDPFPAIGVARASAGGSVADFNLDGLPDIVAPRANTKGSRVYVALANGDGTFTVSDDQAIPSSFYGYDNTQIADFNGDGYPDFIAKASIERHIDVYLNDPDAPGTFERTFRTTVTVQGQLVSNYDEAYGTGDFDGDGNVDVIAVDRLSGESLKLVVFRGDGQGNFSETIETFAYDSLKSNVDAGDLSVGDLNEDGVLDVVSFTTQGPLIHLGNGDGTFMTTDRYPVDPVSQRGRESYVIDFDEDGHLDLVQVTGNLNSSGTILVRRGLGDGTFAEAQRVGLLGGVNTLTFADLDNDGYLDLAYSVGAAFNYRVTDAALYFGKRDGLVDVLAVDLNGDGNEEVLAINEANDRLKLFVGDNLGGLTRQSDLLTGRAPKAVTVADLDGDGTLELIIANRAGRSLSVFSGSVDAGFTAVDYPVGDGAIDVAAADLNDDGKIDLVALDDSNNALWVFTGNGTPILADPVAVALGDRPGRLTLADTTGDGVVDAVVTLPDSNRLMILPGDGAAGFGAPIYVSILDSPSDVAVVDLNDDGNPDLAATLPGENVLSILYGRGGNQFAKAQQIRVGETPTRITLADADEDGRTDLIVANSGDATASVIYNRFDPNEVYRYDADAIDPDDDMLTYAIENGPGGLIINSTTGELLWAASPDQVGIHDVTISADDGRGGVATQTFKIEVVPARDNADPLIATEPSTTIGAGETFEYQAAAVDGDQDALRYRIVDGPDGATIDPTTGLVEWDGRTDQAMIFAPNGQSGSITVPADPSLKPESITVEGWYQLHDLPRFQLLMLDSGRGGSAYEVIVIEKNQNIRVRLHFDDSADRIEFTANISPETDRWYHIVLTYDATSGVATLYVDGVAVGSGATPNPQPLAFLPDADTLVGKNGATATYAIIDNYRIWNVARTPEEIKEGLGRQYEDDPRLVLDYRFDTPNTQNVRDFSPAGNDGVLVRNGLEPQLVPGLANPGVHSFTIGVEDGRGGFDTQSFEVEILPELRGSIVGHLFDDLDGDGVQDDGSEDLAEPSLEGWQLFFDSNNNGFADPSERQTITGADGNYRFDSLLPGDYPVRISPVAGYDTPAGADVSVAANTETVFDLAIEQLALSHIRGQLAKEDADTIAYWKVFADLNGDGARSDDEPMARTDRDGNYALTGLDAGTYTIRPMLPAGWTDTAGNEGLSVPLAADQISTGNDFVLAPTNTSVTGGVHFVTTPPTTIEARQTFQYASVAMGVVDEAITYDLSLAPDGMTVDPSTGLVAWRPTIDQVGEQLVILRATNVSGSISLHDFYLNVSAPNTPPIVVHPATNQPLGVSPRFFTAYAGFAYRYDVIAQDAESTALTYTLDQAPVGATIDPNSGRLSWAPTAADAGAAAFTVVVTDQAGASTTASWSVEVQTTRPNTLPLDITLPRSTAAVTTDYFSRIAGTDALGRSLTWSLATGPSSMTVDANGTIQWTPRSSDLGTQAIELTAATADGIEETVFFSIEVTGRLLNTPPVIESIPVTSVSLGKPFEYDLLVSDADHDIFSFELLEGPAGMSIHPARGSLRWTPAADQLGEADVVVQVADPSGATATQEFKLTVSRFGGPPAIRSIPPTEAVIGRAYLYTVDASDAEGDPLVYTLLAAPAGMSIVETTGEISWTPAVGQLGQQEVVIQVADGVGGASTQAYAIRVRAGALNLPPRITSTSPRFGAVGSLYDYAFTATDPESTAIAYRLGQGPEGMTVDASTGQVTWTPTAGQVGKTVVTLIATDAGGASSIESFEFDVLARNNAPTIDSMAPAEVAAGAEFRYDVLASDADNDQLQFTLTSAPAGATIDPFGRITWPTSLPLLGAHDFQVKVADPRGGEAMQAFSVDVIEDTEAPKLSLIENLGDGNRNILPWQGPFKVFVRAIDNVEVASLTLSANGQDIPLDAAGTATFTFDDWQFAHITATATAIDTNGNTTTKTIGFDYDFPFGWSGAGAEDIPTAIIASPTEAESVVGMVSITGTAAHEDFGSYQLSYRHVSETSFTEFLQSDTPVEGGELGIWDTSLLLNDEYVIRLEVTTNSGVVNVVEQNVGLAGELKLGNFRLSFTDMVIPVAGIPIEITRIYDTLQADREGDFGYGWWLEYRNTDLRVGLPKSGLEDIGIYSALRPGVKVYLNVPGVGRQGFTFNPDIRVLPGFGGNNLVVARPRFTPDPGVTSTLSTGTSSYLQVNELGELYAPGGVPYNPASPSFGGAYVLTTREGITYRIDGANGKLNSATDRNGNQLTFTDGGIENDRARVVAIERDSQGRIRSIADPLGNSTNYRYDSSGNLEHYEDREANVTRFEYATDREHYLENVVDPLNRQLQKTRYDNDGRVVEILGGGNATYEVTYDLSSESAEITDAIGNTRRYIYDNAGNLIIDINENGAPTTFRYDTFGNITEINSPLGAATTNRYDRSGRLLETTDADGNASQFSYDSNGNLVSATNALGVTTTWQYDENGNLIRERLPSGQVTDRDYDERGQLIEISDASGDVVSFEYGDTGPTRVTSPEGVSIEFENDSAGNPVSEIATTVINGTELVSSIQYGSNRNGNLTSVATDGIVSTRSYLANVIVNEVINGQGDRQTITTNESNELIGLDLGGRTYSIARDPLGRRGAVSAAGKELVSTEYDAVGRKSRESYADGTSIVFDYDADNRLIRQTFNDRQSNTYRYTASGKLMESTARDENSNQLASVAIEYDSVGRITNIFNDGALVESRQYDASGNLLAIESETEVLQRYEYDLDGNLISREDSDNNRWQFTYNAAATLTSVVDPLGNQTTYETDQYGDVAAIVDAAGRRTSAVIDGLGRRISKENAAGQRELIVYNDQGRVQAVTRFDGSILEYEYDDKGRVLSEKVDGLTIVDYRYDQGESELESWAIRNGEITINRFNEQGSSVRWQDPFGNTVEQQFFQDFSSTIETDQTVIRRIVEEGQVSRFIDESGDASLEFEMLTEDRTGVDGIRFGEGVTARIMRDAKGLVTQIAVEKSDGTFPLTIDFERNPDGRIVSKSYSTGDSVDFLFDARDQLISENWTRNDGSSNVIRYEYDQVGNRIRRVFDSNDQRIATDELDRISSVNGTPAAHDELGRLTELTIDGVTKSYGYNDAGLLESVTIDNGATTTTVEYEFDVDGILIRRSVDGSVTEKFVWDRFSGVLPMLAEIRNADNELVYRILSDGSRYLGHVAFNEPQDSEFREIAYVTGNLGEVVAMIDLQGNVVDVNLATGFGEQLDEWSGLFGTAAGWRDPITGLTYLRSRWLSNELGRFVTPDPADGTYENPIGLNRYTYAGNDPVGRADPDGYSMLSEIMITITLRTRLAVAGGIGLLAAALARKDTVNYLSGGKTNFARENITGTTQPFLELTIPTPLIVLAGTSGYEAVDLEKPGLFAYIGGNLGLNAKFGAFGKKLTDGAVAFRTARGDVFDTPELEDYEGLFVGISSGARLAIGLLSKKTIGRIHSYSWSPSSVDGQFEKYSHTYTVFKGGTVVGGAATADFAISFGFSMSFYFNLTHLVEAAGSVENFLRGRGRGGQ